MQQLQKIHEHKVNEDHMVKKLADKLQEDLNKKITKAFEQNTDMEKEEEIKRRDEQSKKFITGHVQQMHNMFGHFEEM